MSNSVLNNKFKKWSSLLAQNPDNVDYKNKVSKYGTLMVRAVQGGGNGNGEVDELLRKIDGVVRKNNMNGGGKQVTGYRNMRGGNVDESKAAIDSLKKIIKDQTENSDKLRDSLVGTINKLAESYKAKKQECEKHLANIQAQQQQLTEAQQRLDEAQQQLAENASNKEGHHNELEQLKQQLKLQSESLSGKEGELQNQIRQLQEEIDALKAEKQRWEAEVNQPLKTLVSDAQAKVNAQIEADNKAVKEAEEALNGGSRRTTRRH
uniref:Uncharacterized protein n=1 Tax=viral metagenome TaxID=1070528 RepID=A0A6C0E0K8_9ZZZZ